MAKKAFPKVSIVIPAYREATYIDRLLECLVRQSYKNFEVIVSDANSKDGTKEVVDGLRGTLDIKFVESPPKGPGGQRNVGAKHAKGEWLLFLDADGHTDDAHFLEKMIKTAEHNKWQTATTQNKVHKGRLHEKFGNWLNYRYMRLLSHTKHPVALGWCILTSRKLFERVGGFNKKIYFGEDYDYVSRVGKHGFGFVPDTYFYYDMRRAKQEGIGLSVKAIRNEIYRHTHGYNLESSPYKYNFGKHQKRNKK